MSSQSLVSTDSKQDSMLRCTPNKEAYVISVEEPTGEPSDLQLTMTTRQDGFAVYSVGRVTNTLDTSEMTPRPTSEGITTCPPHHWVITHPRSKFNRGNEGELVETTDQTCKKCGEFRLNEVVVPPERATAPGLELGGS